MFGIAWHDSRPLLPVTPYGDAVWLRDKRSMTANGISANEQLNEFRMAEASNPANKGIVAIQS